jgi:MFS family permease
MKGTDYNVALMVSFWCTICVYEALLTSYLHYCRSSLYHTSCLKYPPTCYSRSLSGRPTTWAYWSCMLFSRISPPIQHQFADLHRCWGTVMTVMGLVQNFAGLCATRFFLGLFEAGFFPGAIYLVGQWYPPNRTQFRMALFYCASATSGAFSGLLAAVIAKMNGV